MSASTCSGQSNIVTLYSFEQADDTSFLTMELLSGETLDRHFAHHRPDLSEILVIGIDVADALAFAHERGVIHRDLKPANVMIDARGQVKVLDFGLVRILDRKTAPLADQSKASLQTLTGRLAGTLAYMSPEPVRGEAVDERTDIFSLGTMIYQLASGELPFQGRTGSDVISSILRDDPPELGQRNPALPPRLGQIVERCLEKDRDRRYARIADVREDLRGLKLEVESGAYLALGSSPGLPHGPVRHANRRALSLSTVALLLLAAALAVGYRFWRTVGAKEGATPQASEVASSAASDHEPFAPAPAADLLHPAIDRCSAVPECRHGAGERDLLRRSHRAVGPRPGGGRRAESGLPHLDLWSRANGSGRARAGEETGSRQPPRRLGSYLRG